MVLPWSTLAVLYAGIYGRVLRGQPDRGLRAGLRAHGAGEGAVGEARVLLRHALRNAVVPVIALFGLDFGALVGGGTLLVEVVFGLHGVGKLTYDGLQNLDLAMVMAAVLYAAVFVVVANALVDLLQAMMDPRTR